MNIVRAKDGRACLHIWREGTEYYRQKSPVFLKEWTNVQFSLLPHPKRGPILRHDLRKPLPFPSSTFDAADCNHVLEHLTPDEGKRFVSELHRVLQPGAVCRVSVPDLERICKDYIHWLETCLRDRSPVNLNKYRWSVYELFDQIVREKGGGKMLELLQSGKLDVPFMKERYGDVFAEFYGEATPDPDSTSSRNPQGLVGKALSKSPSEIVGAVCARLEFSFYRMLRKRKIAQWKGDLRKSRETTRWMYDRFSLCRLLEGQGFEKASVRGCSESDIPNWERYNLDQSNYGNHGIDPSVYVEARKPSPTFRQKSARINPVRAS